MQPPASATSRSTRTPTGTPRRGGRRVPSRSSSGSTRRPRGSTTRTRRSTSGSRTAILNVSVNCLDRHLAAGGGDKTAYIWVGEPADDERTISYRELHDEVNRFANVLKSLGVRARRPRRDLPRHGPRAPGRDAGVRAHRRRALGRVRRLLLDVARRTHRRRRVQGADHRRRRVAQGPDRAAEGQRRRRARTERGRLDRARGRPAAHRARRGLDRGTRPLVARADGRAPTTGASPSGSAPRRCCTSSTPRARPRARRASCTRAPATCSARS